MKNKISYVCGECGAKSPKWLGRCPKCQSWNSYEEEITETAPAGATGYRTVTGISGAKAAPFSDEDAAECDRIATGIGELDRVLGGGLVSGSVVLLSGEPGIGKSTLLMQLSGEVAKKGRNILYISGEESRGQLKMRADRLGVKSSSLQLLTDGDIDNIISESQRLDPDIIIADSVQTLSDSRLNSLPGSIMQVKETASRLIYEAKEKGIAVILIGHVNKEGGIAGPKVLEHIVDAVLYFEGERRGSNRIVRAVKNRFGSTNEIGVFEMTSEGLAEIPNPSEMLLRDRPHGVSGNCAVCIMEGTRPIIAEIQALAASTVYPSPKRTANGIDFNRMGVLLAVLEKRLGLRFSTQDIYLNVIGGLRIDEPASDLAAAMSLISAILDRPLPDDIIAVGEVGLAGECRAVTEAAQRIREAERLGFRRMIMPQRTKDISIPKTDIKIITINSIYEAIKFFENTAE